MKEAEHIKVALDSAVKSRAQKPSILLPIRGKSCVFAVD